MPFERPTLADLISRIDNDFVQTLGPELAPLSVEQVLARITAATAHGLHGHLAWLAAQIFPDTADDENVLRWASTLGLTLLPSNAATGNATFATTGDGIGAGVRATTPDGQEYEVRIASGVSGGVTQALLDAVTPGLAGNQVLGTPITLSTPVAGVTSEGTIGQMSGGSDVETVEQLRVRVLRRLAYPPRGGAPGDYESWALEVPGVARAWERVLNTGDVQLYFIDGEAGGSQIFAPSAARREEARAYIAARAPVTVPVTVPAITFSPQTITLSSLTPNTAEVQAAVTAELMSLFLRDAAVPFPAAGPVPGAGEPDGSLLISRIREAISAAAGETDHVLASPVADIAAPAEGSLLTLGGVVFLP